MSLTANQRARYARQTLLPEIAAAGQVRLCAAAVAPIDDADPHAWSVARDYLERAGLHVDDVERTDVVHADIASAASLDAMAPAHLRHAAAALVGAFAAVETIKAVVSVGRRATLPTNFRLISEES